MEEPQKGNPKFFPVKKLCKTYNWDTRDYHRNIKKTILADAGRTDNPDVAVDKNNIIHLRHSKTKEVVQTELDISLYIYD